MEEIAEVYARSLFEVASERGQVDTVAEQLGQFTDALREHRELQVFFFSPNFSAKEKLEGLRRGVEGAEPILQNFLEVLIERHRTPAIFRIRDDFDRMAAAGNKRLPVQLTSAVELDQSVVDALGRRIGEQTGNEIELTSRVDPAIVGGVVLRVGNFILDASIKTRLEHLRREVAQA